LSRDPLGPGDVHIWYRTTESFDDDAVEAAVALLSDDERARFGRFVFARDRRDFAAAHALVRRALSAYAEVSPRAWTFEWTAGGKPFLTPSQAGSPPLTFNLSHTRGLVACAVGREADLGIDVEQIDLSADRRDLARRFFAPVENALLDDTPAGLRAARLTELWTLKEAFLKATGAGLARPLDQFGFSYTGTRGIRFDAPPDTDPDRWTFALFGPSSSARLAVAIRFNRPVRHIVARADGGLDRLHALRATENAPV
jgi:4'-phosphopantetheinyl transferase